MLKGFLDGLEQPVSGAKQALVKRFLEATANDVKKLFEDLSKHTVPQLKQLLRDRNESKKELVQPLPLSGNKVELVERLLLDAFVPKAADVKKLAEELNEENCQQLKERLKNLNENVNGLKKDLVQRLLLATFIPKKK
jgi:hypothetical protein